LRKVYILPNLFTAASLFCGMLAIMETFNGNDQRACVSDLIAFGAAPAILAYSVLWDEYPRLSAAVCSLFAICGALRLARFNVQATREERKTFTGLPIPAGALAIMSLIWLYHNNPILLDYLPRRVALPPALVVIAYLMVSNIPFFGLKSVQLVGRQRFEMLVTFVVITCLVFMLAHYLEVLLFAMAWLYLILGPFLAIRQQRALATRQAHGNDPAESSDLSAQSRTKRAQQ
jgi:CDP-diacylglycerol--serine O-phosphatidyltransferase